MGKEIKAVGIIKIEKQRFYRYKNPFLKRQTY